MKTQIKLITTCCLMVCAVIGSRAKDDEKKAVKKTNYTTQHAQVIDPRFEKTHDAMDWISMAICILASDTTVSHTYDVKDKITKGYYGGSGTFHSQAIDEFELEEIFLVMNQNYFKPAHHMGDAVIAEATKNNRVPLIHSFHGSPWNAGFMEGFSIATSQTAMYFPYYTYLTIPKAPTIYGGMQTYSTLFDKPLVVIPQKEYAGDSLLDISTLTRYRNPYLPIQGYKWNYTTQKIDTLTFLDWNDVEYHQFNDMYIWVIGFDTKVAVSKDNQTGCENPVPSCGDNYCDFFCGEDTNNCFTDCKRGVFRLVLEDLQIEEDVRDMSTSPSQFLREPGWKGKYSIYVSAFIIHPNGRRETLAREFVEKWKRAEIPIKSIDASGNIVDSNGAMPTPKHGLNVVLSNSFSVSAPYDSKLYLMIYEADAFSRDEIQVNGICNGIASNGYLYYTASRDELPFGSKAPDPPDDEPDHLGNFNHIIEIPGSAFGPGSGVHPQYFYDGSKATGSGYGVTFKIYAYKIH